MSNLNDIYNQKSGAHRQLVNIKLASILLRLADVLDICRYRISRLLLDHNIEDMDPTSRFHWISHLLTDKYSIDTRYELGNDKSKIQAKFLTEIITIHIYVLTHQETPIQMDGEKTCAYVQKAGVKYDDKKPWIITIPCSSSKADKCDGTKCSFLCRWFIKKNEYLLPELGALLQYLTSLPDNYFKPEIKIVLEPISDTRLPDIMFDYLREQI